MDMFEKIVAWNQERGLIEEDLTTKKKFHLSLKNY